MLSQDGSWTGIGRTYPSTQTCWSSRANTGTPASYRWISSPPAGRVRISVRPAESILDFNKVSTAAEADSSLRSFAWLDCSDPSTFFWRTYQRSLFETWVEFSDHWPASGWMSSGRVWRLPTLDSPKPADAASWWPTPTTRDWKDTGSLANVPENSLLGRVFKNRTGLNLDPLFSEWLMGFPYRIEWTEPEPSGILSARLSLNGLET